MMQKLPRWLVVVALLIPALELHAQAASPLAPETQLVTASGAPAATEETFTISSAEDLVVTFTDLQVPAALSSASIVVTQGASIVSMTTLATPATTATLNLPDASGVYTLRVIGTPSTTTNDGTFTVCVAPKATPSACIADASMAGNIAVQSTPTDPTVSTTTTTLTVTTAGAYTFTYADAQFPVALSVPPSFALFQGSVAVAVPIAASPATITLSPGTYTLFGIAQADPTVKAGLYGITISGPAGVSPILNSAFPVGTLAAASQLTNPDAQNLTLTLTDFGFPTALAGIQAIVTSGATTLGMLPAAGTVNFMVPAEPLQVWSFGAAGTGAGTYEVDLTSASSSLLQTAAGVNNGNSLAFAFVTPKALAAGSYQATANDFQFPAALQSLQFAVAQGDAIQKKASGAGTFSFTAMAAPAVVLISTTPTSNSNGMFDVNLQTAGGSPQIVFDQTQGVSTSGVFTSQSINVGVSGNFDVTLSDLQFPTQFANLALLVSNAGAVVGKIYGGGTFTIAATPGTYQLNFIAMPGTAAVGAQPLYGMYGLQMVDSAPTVTLTASSSSVTTGATTTLSWTTTNTTACTATGGTFTGSQATAGTLAVIVSATTTYTLTCTGAGGSGAQSVTVTATAATAKSGGGGSMNICFLGLLSLLTLVRLRSLGRYERR